MHKPCASNVRAVSPTRRVYLNTGQRRDARERGGKFSAGWIESAAAARRQNNDHMLTSQARQSRLPPSRHGSSPLLEQTRERRHDGRRSPAPLRADFVRQTFSCGDASLLRLPGRRRKAKQSPVREHLRTLFRERALRRRATRLGCPIPGHSFQR